MYHIKFLRELRNSILIGATVIVFTVCSNSQTTNVEICQQFLNIDSLVDCLESEYLELTESKDMNDAMDYFKAFPCSFEEFLSVFGYFDMEDSVKTSPLYSKSYEFIELFFRINIDRKLFSKKVIRITSGSTWSADAVNHFQSFLLHYLKEDNRVMLEELANSSDNAILDFWKFTLFGPHPEKNEKHYIELKDFLDDEYPKLDLMLTSAYKELLKESKEKKH